MPSPSVVSIVRSDSEARGHRWTSDTATELRVLHNIAALNGQGLRILSRLTDFRNKSVARRLRPSATTSARRDISPFHSTWRVTTLTGHSFPIESRFAAP